MYFSNSIALARLFKCTAILNYRVVKILNVQQRKLLKLNNISLPKSSCLIGIRTRATDSSVLESVENPKEIELTPIPPEFEELANNPEISKKIRVILMEYEMHKLTDKRIPSALKAKDMEELLDLKGYMGRKKYLNYLFLKEILPKIQKEKREKKRLKKLEEEQLRERENDHIRYGLCSNTFLLYIRMKTMNRFYQFRQGYALMFGQPLVFDLGFEENMTKREVINMIDQLALAHHENKIHNDPFNLYFTNLSFESPLYSHLKTAMAQIETEDNNMITVSNKSYLDLFPKEKLVYLSPDAPNTMEKYDPDAIYIIGGIVDKRDEIPLTMAKAKQEGIRMAKLPLRDYLMWGTSSKKCLTLNQTLKIMLDIKYTQDWKKALGAVPSRKIKRVEEVQELELAKQERLRKRVEQLERREKRKVAPEIWRRKI